MRSTFPLHPPFIRSGLQLHILEESKPTRELLTLWRSWNSSWLIRNQTFAESNREVNAAAAASTLLPHLCVCVHVCVHACECQHSVKVSSSSLQRADLHAQLMKCCWVTSVLLFYFLRSSNRTEQMLWQSVFIVSSRCNPLCNVDPLAYRLASNNSQRWLKRLLQQETWRMLSLLIAVCIFITRVFTLLSLKLTEEFQ